LSQLEVVEGYGGNKSSFRREMLYLCSCQCRNLHHHGHLAGVEPLDGFVAVFNLLAFLPSGVDYAYVRLDIKDKELTDLEILGTGACVH
jgi:hypothetical protein